MALDDLTQAVREKVGPDPGIPATVKFVLDGAGVIHVDGTATPPAIVNDDLEADCTITTSAEDFQKMMAGEMDATSAFLTGKLSVDGDMGVAMSIARVI